jgi:hypothetical protein
MLWYRKEQLRLPPGAILDFHPLDTSDRLEKLRAEAIKAIRRKLRDRVKEHLGRVRAGHRTQGVVVKNQPGPGPCMVLGDGGWDGLPGLYWPDVPIPLVDRKHGRGEPTLGELEALKELRGSEALTPFGIVDVGEEDLRELDRRLREDEQAIDLAAIAEDVTGSYEMEARVKKALQRFAKDVSEWEYQVIGGQALTGRKSLPASRA